MLDDYAKEFAYCAYCPKLCRHACPVANAERRESVIPGAKMAAAHMMRNDMLPMNAEYASLFYACNGCGLCTEYCEHDIPVFRALFSARAAAVDQGAQPKSLDGFVERFYRRNDKLVRKLHQLVDEHYFVEDAQVAYMPGCDVIDTSPEVVGQTLEVLAAAGVDYVAVMESDLVCGGYPLWVSGNLAEFRHVAEQMAARLNSYRKVVSACPSCVYLFRQVYPEMGITVTAEVQHISEFLDTVAHRLDIPRRQGKAYYHDPCYLGRNLGVFDPPRRLAGRVLEEVVEFSENREKSYCCGGGGLVTETAPKTAEATARRRLEEPHESGATTVVTACATCVRTLKKGTSNLEVVDLVTLLHRAISKN